MIFDDVLQELIDLHEQTRCGCGHPACNRCNDGVHIEETIGKGLRSKHKFRHMPDTYFICGDGGFDHDSGLPEYIFVCSMHGSGHSAIYKRIDTENEDIS